MSSHNADQQTISMNVDKILEGLLGKPKLPTDLPEPPLIALQKRVSGLTDVYYHHLIKIEELSEENHQLKVYIANMRHYSERKFSELNVAKEAMEQQLKAVSEQSAGKDLEIMRLKGILENQQRAEVPTALQRLLEGPRRQGDFPIPHLMPSSCEISITSTSSSPESLESDDRMPRLSCEKEDDEEEIPFVKTFEEAVKINATFDFGELAGRDLTTYLFNPHGDRTLPQKVGSCRNRYNFFQNQVKSFENTHLQWKSMSDKEKDDWTKLMEMVLAIQEVQEKYGMVVVDVLGRKRERQTAGSGDKKKAKLNG